MIEKEEMKFGVQFNRLTESNPTLPIALKVTRRISSVKLITEPLGERSQELTKSPTVPLK